MEKVFTLEEIAEAWKVNTMTIFRLVKKRGAGRVPGRRRLAGEGVGAGGVRQEAAHGAEQGQGEHPIPNTERRITKGEAGR